MDNNQLKDYVLKYSVIASKRFRKKEKIRYINNRNLNLSNMKHLYFLTLVVKEKV